jgi:hypothetical protein
VRKALIVEGIVVLALLLGSCAQPSYTNDQSSSTATSKSSTDVTSETGNVTRESSNVVSETRDVSGFNQVELNGVGNLSIQQAGSESLTVEAEEDVLQKIQTEVADDRLVIGPKPNTTINTTEPINYKLSVKDLNALKLSGSGNIDAEGISTDRLAVTISGAGKVEAAGRADSQDIDISGSGSYQAENLESEEVKIEVKGSGSATVNVSDELDAKVSGSGSVYYTGDPVVNRNVRGSGRVAKR